MSLTDINTILSVGAFVISLFSLLVSYFSYREQITRERREELRGIVEKLIEIRAEFNRLPRTVKNDLEMEQDSSKLNSLRSVYLEAAEILIRKIPGLASVIELGTVGFENESESDFRQARKYYEKAMSVSKKSSLVNQCIAHRGFASSFFYYPPFLDVEKGRLYFRKSIDILKNENDPYSYYTLCTTCRLWAIKEGFWGNFDFAATLYNEGIDYISRMPDWFDLKKYETKFYAQQLSHLANNYLNKDDFEKTFACIQKSEELLDKYNDEFSMQIRGFTSLQWLKIQLQKGEKIDPVRLQVSKIYFDTLPNTDPFRASWQSIIEDAVKVQMSYNNPS